MQYNGGKEQTRLVEQNICNLAYAQFDSDNKYGIPNMLRTDVGNPSTIRLQGFNFCTKEKHPEGKTCHFFLHDYRFECVWRYPDRYTEMLKKFDYVLSPDFSPYSDMPKCLQVYNVYRNRWCGRYWQEHGINVIPTVTWSNTESLEFALCGIPKQSAVAISTMGEGRWAKWQSLFENWQYVMNQLEPKVVILYGKDLRNQLYQPPGCVIINKSITSMKAED